MLIDPVQKVSLSSSNLKNSIQYWKDVLEMSLVEEKDKTAVFEYAKNQAKLELKDIGKVEFSIFFFKL